MGNMIRTYLCCLILFVNVGQVAFAQDTRRPLLMEGKTSLYQTVLTRPGAALYQNPDHRSPIRMRLIPTLSIFYVYDRRTVDSEEWLEVGAGRRGPTQGWLRANKTIHWKQTITLAFTKRDDRDVTLFFRDRDQLFKLIDSELMARDVSGYRKTIKKGRIPNGFPVVAVEPETTVSPEENFYLLPILDFEIIDFDVYTETRLLKIASVTLEEDTSDMLEKGAVGSPVRNKAELLDQYRTGIVFVIDSTISMGPYINRTREAVRRIYRRLQQANLGKKLSFGLVAFRDSIVARPGLEYVTRIFATLKDGLDQTSFFQKVEAVSPAGVPSKGFNEDAFAGFRRAIEDIAWGGYGGRFIVLITDAGARPANDRYSATKLGARILRITAQEKEGGAIAVAVLHLLTPEGQHTHKAAARQYKTLSQWSKGAGSYYFGVEAGEIAEFGKTVDRLADEIVKHVELTSAGEITKIPPQQESNEMERKSAIIGRAMQLAYLGRAGKTRAPRLYTAWVAERDFIKQDHKTVEVRVLITKNQLSDLTETLETIFEAGERTGLLASKDFFSQLQAVAASLAREKGEISQRKIQRLVDVGLAGEWLSDLPYRSQVMNLTDDKWQEMSKTEQQELFDYIEEKMILYSKFHDDTDRWVNLVEKGNAMTTIPIEMLP